MTDDEFDLIDELYFVQPYSYLKETLDWEDEKLLVILQRLLEKEWIKCLYAPDEEIFGDFDISKEGKQLFYLATKKGLIHHNTI
ncbi:hypothetical protein [Pleomorphovibrio marinus]|uniref:hypothetical protein n=1 Tax=Pleomorphovibrio marinus TaxID=2164132 RepID=UPI000E0AF20C|nr:hypothetical protein [Pleomorphovibrio marinus]